MKMTPESAAVEAVACHRVTHPSLPIGGHVWRDGDIPADELAYWIGLNDGYIVERAYPQSALDALRGEVADRDAVIECKNIDIRERDRSLHEWAERVRAAERRVAQLTGLLSDTAGNLRRMANDEFADCDQVRLEHVVNRIDATLRQEKPE